MTCRNIDTAQLDAIRASATMEDAYVAARVRMTGDQALQPPEQMVPSEYLAAGATMPGFLIYRPAAAAGQPPFRAYNLALLQNDDARRCALLILGYDETRDNPVFQRIYGELQAQTNSDTMDARITARINQEAEGPARNTFARQFAIWRTLQIVSYLRTTGNRDAAPDTVTADEIGAWALQLEHNDSAAARNRSVQILRRLNTLLGLVENLNNTSIAPTPITLTASQASAGANVVIAPNATTAFPTGAQIFVDSSTTPLTGVTTDAATGITIPYASVPAGAHTITIKRADGSVFGTTASFTTLAAPTTAATGDGGAGGGIDPRDIGAGGSAPDAGTHGDGGIGPGDVGAGGSAPDAGTPTPPASGGGTTFGDIAQGVAAVIGGLTVVGGVGYLLYRTGRTVATGIGNFIASRRAAPAVVAPAADPAAVAAAAPAAAATPAAADPIDRALDGLERAPGAAGTPPAGSTPPPVTGTVPSDQASVAHVRPELVRAQILSYFPELGHSDYSGHVDRMVQVSIERFNTPADRPEMYNEFGGMKDATAESLFREQRDVIGVSREMHGLPEGFVRASVSVRLRELIAIREIRTLDAVRVSTMYAASETHAREGREGLLERVREIHRAAVP